MPFNGDWSDYLDEHIGAKPAPPPPDNVVHINSGAQTSYAAAALRREADNLANTSEGARNDTLNRAAYNIAGFVRSGELDPTTAQDTLADAAQHAGLDPHEIANTIRSAFNGAHTKNHTRRTPARDDTNTNGQQADSGDEPGWQFTPGDKFILDQPDTIPALWGDGNDILWAEGESLMIAGPMGLGKTTLAGMLIRAQLGLAASDVIGHTVHQRPGRILYLAMDRPQQIARAFARQCDETDRQTLHDRLLIWQGPPPYDVAKQPTILAALADAAQADTIYVDSLKDAALGLSEDEVGAGYNRARQHLLATGRQLAELHHTTKRGAGGGPPTHVTDVYGSAWLTNGTGSIILLSGEPGDPIVGFKHPRQPANEIGPLQLLHDQEKGLLTVNHRVDLVTLAALAGADGLTAKAAAAALFDTGKPSRAETEKARRKLDRLVDTGHLRRVEGAKGQGADSAPAAWFTAGLGLS